MDPIAQKLAQNGKVLDLGKDLSYGKDSGTNNMIDERVKAANISWEIKNTTSDNHYVVISSLFDNAKNQTIFTNVNDMLANVVPGVSSTLVWAFKDGRLTGTTGAELVCASRTSGRNINQFLSYIGQTPTRICGVRMKSTVASSGAQDQGNYDQELRTVFFSPLSQPVENLLSLSRFVKPTSFSGNIVDISFIDEAFPVILSNEHFMVLQVNAGTILNLTLQVGAQDSRAQRMWRNIKKADDVIRGLR